MFTVKSFCCVDSNIKVRVIGVIVLTPKRQKITKTLIFKTLFPPSQEDRQETLADTKFLVV